VAHIVKKYDHNKEDVDDLISIGTIGLIKGIDSYSNKHGTRITTYCARCIENEILMYFRGNKKNNKNMSINESIGFDKDGNEITFLDILKTPKPDYALDIHKQDSIDLLKRYFNILTEREQEIVIKRYGLNNNDEVTQKEIAKQLGISRSYVSRIEKRALTKILREFLRNDSDILN
ncbi:MAG: sigma-70 family RNA polymerase sigma factor, partial [Bacilli bacterium]|nr:sigma-70 family RNA polymerase sigma factor [Bacilli bacterium]